MLRDFSFPPLNLPSLVSEKSKGVYAERVSDLNSIASGAGKGSDAFARRKKELWHARQSFREITRVMTSSSYIRPLIDLWRTEPDFFNDAPPCRVLFELIEAGGVGAGGHHSEFLEGLELTDGVGQAALLRIFAGALRQVLLKAGGSRAFQPAGCR